MRINRSRSTFFKVNNLYFGRLDPIFKSLYFMVINMYSLNNKG